MQEGRRGALHVLVSGTAMTVERGDRTYDCNLVAGGVAVHATSAAGTLLPASEVLRVAVPAGAYGVSRVPGATIAG